MPTYIVNINVYFVIQIDGKNDQIYCLKIIMPTYFVNKKYTL